MAEGMIDLSEENFAATIAEGLTLVDFYADWCGPCRMMAPILGELAKEMSGKIKVGKLDIEKASTTTASYQVTSIPTLILFKGGKEVERIVGLKDRAVLEKTVQRHL